MQVIAVENVSRGNFTTTNANKQSSASKFHLLHT